MATKVERAKAILDALADPATVDNAMATRVANAFATYSRMQSNNFDISDLTVTQKADNILVALRRLVKDTVRTAEVAKAQEDARKATAPTAEIDLGS